MLPTKLVMSSRRRSVGVCLSMTTLSRGENAAPHGNALPAVAGEQAVADRAGDRLLVPVEAAALQVRGGHQVEEVLVEGAAVHGHDQAGLGVRVLLQPPLQPVRSEER